MAHAFYIKQGDLLPIISGAPENEDGEIIPHQAAASVGFHMRASGLASAHIKALATITNTVDLGLPGNPASQLRLAYVWQAGDTPTAGLYEAEFETTFLSGKTQTWPNNAQIPVRIGTQIA
jgi:hypothetical protein